MMNVTKKVLGLVLGLALVLGSAQAAKAADCSEGVKVSETCDGLSYEGCCDGDLTKWCDTPEGPTCMIDCGEDSATCGWKAEGGFYACQAEATEDPSGTFPYDCIACDPACTEGQFCNAGTCEACSCGTKQCGTDQCGVSCGTCTGENEICNAMGMCEVCLPKCEGKNCGDDGCGGTCGECASLCAGGVCYLTDGCAPEKLGVAGCAGCECEACACAVDDFCCGTEWDGICQQICLFECDGCGALASCGDGLCVGAETCVNCGADCGCQAGDVCFEYACCTPMCTDKNCGDDGCGGTCGTCTGENEICNAEGVCEVCTPQCTDKECGDNGCGGTCGTCTDGKVCSAGKCVEGGNFPAECNGEGTPSGTDCLGTTYEGCCANGRVYWCDGDALYCLDCAASQAMCGWFDAGYYGCDDAGMPDPTGANPQDCAGGTCTPNCGTRECGGDGCGGQCGTCPEGKTCNASGMCEEGVCVPNCTDKTCGDDGCGGSCGTCGANQTCEAGVCKDTTCTPVCAGKECGDDGCGGFCGTCGDGMTCQNGTCKAPMPTDVVTEDDVPVTENDVTTPENDVTEPGKTDGGSSGGCSSSANSSNASSLLLALALAALLFVRRFRG